jgi:hypothetical protein
MENSGILNKRNRYYAQWGFVIGGLTGLLFATTGYGAHILAVRLDRARAPGDGQLIPFMLEMIWFWTVFPLEWIGGALGLSWPRKWTGPAELWKIYWLASLIDIILFGLLGVLIGLMVKRYIQRREKL